MGNRGEALDRKKKSDIYRVHANVGQKNVNIIIMRYRGSKKVNKITMQKLGNKLTSLYVRNNSETHRCQGAKVSFHVALNTVSAQNGRHCHFWDET